MEKPQQPRSSVYLLYIVEYGGRVIAYKQRGRVLYIVEQLGRANYCRSHFCRGSVFRGVSVVDIFCIQCQHLNMDQKKALPPL